MKSLLILSLFFILQSCSSHVETDTDEQFMEEYTNCLMVLSAFRSGALVPLQDRIRAVECLVAITEIDAPIVRHSDSPYLYFSTSEGIPENDIYLDSYKKWIEWYQKNYSKYSKAQAFKKIKERGVRLDEDLSWPSKIYDISPND